jgi:rubredoxin
MNLYPDPPATLGSTAAASARIVVWCRACNYQVEPDPAEQAQRYGAETSVHDWHKRLVCSRCGGREIDFVLTGVRR